VPATRSTSREQQPPAASRTTTTCPSELRGCGRLITRYDSAPTDTEVSGYRNTECANAGTTPARTHYWKPCRSRRHWCRAGGGGACGRAGSAGLIARALHRRRRPPRRSADAAGGQPRRHLRLSEPADGSADHDAQLKHGGHAGGSGRSGRCRRPPLHAGRRAIVVQTDMSDDDGRRVAQVTHMQAVITDMTSGGTRRGHAAGRARGRYCGRA